MFEPGLWRHRCFKDVDFLVMETFREGSRTKLMGMWQRRDLGCGSYLIHRIDEFWVPDTNQADWTQIN